MARINVSISDELKEQMDKLPSVNWSSVAQEAFATRVRITQLSEVNMEAAAIERLRASKGSNEEMERAEGVALGKQWALHKAGYAELRAVADLAEGLGGEWDAPGPLRHIMEAMDEGEDSDTLMSLFDSQNPSEALLEGFIEGAAEVFDKV